MPDPAVLSELGQAMRAQLPPVLRDSIDYLAIIHAYARELDLLEVSIERLRAQFNPATADILLNAWEYELNLPVGGVVGATLAQRQSAVFTRLLGRIGGQGREWEAKITQIVGPGWSYNEHDPADPSSPVDGTILVTLPFAPGDSQFIDASNRIRVITDAHLEVNFASNVLFHLDQSPMDSTQFGA